MMADKGIWLSIQPFLDDEDAVPFPPGSLQHYKKAQVVAGTDRAYGFAKKFGIKTAFGTDILFSPQLAGRQGAMLAKMTRWYKPARTAEDGNVNQRRHAGAVRIAQSLSRQARRG